MLGAQTPDQISKTKLLLEKNVIGILANPRFRQEEFLSKFYHQPTPEIQKKYDSRQLCDLLIGCYEQIGNIDKILETIIKNDQSEDNKLIIALNNLFNFMEKSIDLRFLCYNELKKFRMMNIQNSSEITLAGLKAPNFEIILKALEMYNDKNGDMKEPELENLYQYYKLNKTIPIMCFPEPNASFKANVRGGFQSFNANNVLTHGVSSNGQFLFVLCEEGILQIFPLFNVGTLMTPFQRNISGVKIDKNTSMIASKTYIILYTTTGVFKLKIAQLINKNYKAEKLAGVNNIVACSNGFSGFKLEKSNHVEMFQFVSSIKKRIKLTKGFKEIKEKIDYFKYPFASNGQYLAFIVKPENLKFYVYRTFSLISGEHISDFQLSFEKEIVSFTYDSYNRCHWVVTLDNGHFGIQKYYCPGSVDCSIFDFSYDEQKANSRIKKFINNFSLFTMHYCGSNINLTSYYTKDNKSLIKLLELANSMLENCQNLALIQSFIFLINANLKNLSLNLSSKKVRKLCFNLIEILPINYRIYFFFNNLHVMLNKESKRGVKILVELFSYFDVNDRLLSFALAQLETTEYISLIPINEMNSFSKLFLSDDSVNQKLIDFPSLQALMLVHQRVLFMEVTNYLESPNNGFNEFSNNDDNSPLNKLIEYSKFILSNFNDLLAQNNLQTINNSFLFILMENLLSLISKLMNYHVIAKEITKIFYPLLLQINTFLKGGNLDLEGNSKLSIIVRKFLFIYAKNAATLLEGSSISKFEREFSKLICSNLDNDADLTDTDINCFSDQLNAFLSEKGDTYIMKNIYKKFKPFLHKNLNDDLKFIDRLSLAGFVKHLGLWEELIRPQSTFSPQFKLALDQMMRVRNYYRNQKQSGKENIDFIKNKCHMLIRMESDGTLPPKLLGDFICSKETVEEIISLIKQQIVRTNLTLVGFSLIDKILSIESTKMYYEIIAYALSQIQNFESLSIVLEITNTSTSPELASLFNRMLEIVIKDPESKISLVIFRIFRDIKNIPGIRFVFLNQILSQFHRNRTLFALSISLLSATKSVPISLNNPEQSPMGYLLQSITFSIVPCSYEFFSKFSAYFWENKSGVFKLLCRVMFNLLNSINLEKEIIQKEFVRLITMVGNNFMKFQSLSSACEIIWILRRILNEKTTSYDYLVETLLSISPKSDEMLQIGLFAILGNYIEPIRTFCNINFQDTSNHEYIALSTDEQSKYYCFKLPFELNNEPIIVDKSKSYVYAVPQVLLKYESFTDYEFILSFAESALLNLSSLKAAFYIQLVSYFCKYKSFVEKLPEKIYDIIYDNPLPFNKLPNMFQYIRETKNLRRLPTNGCFSQLQTKTVEMTSYISPQIKSDALFRVQYLTNINTNSYFGIISDTLEKYYTRFSIIGYPTGNLYPINQKILNFTGNQVDFIVDNKNKVIIVNNIEIEFPEGNLFRVIIAYPKSLQVQINVNENNFVMSSWPEIPIMGSYYSNNQEKLYKVPKNASNNNFNVKEILNPIEKEKMIRNNFYIPPDSILIHLLYSSMASTNIINDQINGVIRSLICQFSTICLMRISKFKPESIKIPLKIFTLLSIQLEQFSMKLFDNGLFPFNIWKPSWKDSNVLFMSLETEAKESILSLLGVQSNVDLICDALYSMCECSSMHLLLCPNNYHKRPIGLHNSILCLEPSIIFFNNLMAYDIDCIKFNNRLRSVPTWISSNDAPALIEFKNETDLNEVSIFEISDIDNSFCYDTAFEAMIILKNLLYIPLSDRNKMIIKSAFLDMFIIQSPLVINYINQFFDLLEIRLPTLSSDSKNYKKKLYLFLKVCDLYKYNRGICYFNSEIRSITDTQSRNLSQFFPEFLLSESPITNTSTVVQIKYIPLDPGCYFHGYDDKFFTYTIQCFTHFSINYDSLKGFPFWEIFPYWIKVCDVNSENEETIDPFVERSSANVIHISNPSQVKFEARLKGPPNKITPNTLLMVSSTPNFQNILITKEPKNIFEKFTISGRHSYVALIENKDQWNSFEIEILGLDENKSQKTTEVDISKIHDQFVSDMYEFAVKWKEEHTEELRMLLSKYALSEPNFTSAKAIAMGSNLIQIFSPTVIVLRALILHHFNYIKSNFYNMVPQYLWNNLKSFVCYDDAIIEVNKRVVSIESHKYSMIHINRHAAQRVILNGEGNPEKSIIFQLTTEFAKIDQQMLRCKPRPFRVKFVDENAIDAGGPLRELFADASSSIFEPTTQLFVLSPNGRHKIGDNQDTYIPLDINNSYSKHYETIGTLLGIIIRIGVTQNLPFAPLVWKYLVKEDFTQEDILELDDNMAKKIKELEDSIENDTFQEGTLQWSVEDWNDNIVPLSKHQQDVYVKKDEVKQYIAETINYRKYAIIPSLMSIRKAFINNIGFNPNSLTPALLSRITQGSNTITVDQLKSITVISDYDDFNDPVIVNFWEAVEKLTDEEIKLLLKFITSSNRLPNLVLKPNYKLMIDKLPAERPDLTLPTASTCFRRLHLPSYSKSQICYEKLLYAIKNCQTMENK